MSKPPSECTFVPTGRLRKHDVFGVEYEQQCVVCPQRSEWGAFADGLSYHRACTGYPLRPGSWLKWILNICGLTDERALKIVRLTHAVSPAIGNAIFGSKNSCGCGQRARKCDYWFSRVVFTSAKPLRAYLRNYAGWLRRAKSLCGRFARSRAWAHVTRAVESRRSALVRWAAWRLLGAKSRGAGCRTKPKT